MATATAKVPARLTRKYSPEVQNGAMRGDEIVIHVDPNDPNEYLVYFRNANVFGEAVRLLKKGDNVFTRVSGQFTKTSYKIVNMSVTTYSIRDIPPK